MMVTPTLVERQRLSDPTNQCTLTISAEQLRHNLRQRTNALQVIETDLGDYPAHCCNTTVPQPEYNAVALWI